MITRHVLAVTAAAAAGVVFGSAAYATVPSGRSISDLAAFSDITCERNGVVVSHDLLVNPGGGNVAWLPDGTHLVGTSFTMYDAAGNLILTKTYGGSNHQADATVTCTSTGPDPDSGQSVTVVFTAAIAA